MNNATFKGIIALLLWGSSPLAILHLGRIDPLQILCTGALIAILVTFYKVARSSQLSIMSLVQDFCIFECTALFGTQLSYILAFRKGPPELVELVTYLWPLLSLAVLIFNKQVPRPRVFLIAISIAFLGLGSFLYPDIHRGELPVQCVLLALLGACCWTFFMLRSKKNETMPEVIGLYMGFNACIVAFVLLKSNIYTQPTLVECIALLYLGITGYSLAFYLWSEGVQSGQMGTLLVFSYFNPLVSILMLVIALYTPMTYRLLFSSLAVCFAGYIACTNTEPTTQEVNIG